jgi:hypothetical protein
MTAVPSGASNKSAPNSRVSCAFPYVLDARRFLMQRGMREVKSVSE